VAVTGLSLPGAAVMTLAGGAVFGLFWGLLLVSFASSLGATLAFLARASCCATGCSSASASACAAINAGVEKEGGFYLFTLRLVPVFPFFVINLLMGLTPIKTRTFYWVSQLGMLAGTLVYVNAGTQLARIDSLAGILSPALLGSFVLLGIFPLIAKKIVDALAARKVYAAGPEAGALRPQPDRHRRRQRRAGHRLHRRGGQGQGDADRKAQARRRLPEHRLRALEGADPLGQAALAHAARRSSASACARPSSTSPR
jgi:uncharacterized membrane protein YdjX (TVP38/TMEM64 family)